MAKLRRPNQFIGLDKIKRPFPPEPKTTTNYPIVLAIVDSENPAGVFSDDPKRHMTWKGMISPEERKVEVSKTVCFIFFLCRVTNILNSTRSLRLSNSVRLTGALNPAR